MKEKIQKILEKLGIKESLQKANQKYADFTLTYFKQPEKAQEIAKKLQGKIEGVEVSVIESYVNFSIKPEFLASHIVKEILEKKEKYGSSKKGEGESVVVDYSSPNIGKPLHVGHIRSTVIGDSIIKILNFSGYNTKGINYINDVGLHIGKIIAAYQLWGDDKKIEKNPEKELLKLYVKYCKKEKFEVGEELRKTPDKEDLEKGENKWAKKAKEILLKLEQGDKKTVKIWKKIEKFSLQSFNKIYKLLDVKFDETIGSSNFSEKGKEIVELLLRKGLAYKSKDGAVIVKLEEKKLPDKVVLRSDGTALYSTQDLGAAVTRYARLKFDKMVYVVGSEQKTYFKQLFQIFKLLDYKWADSCYHLAFGLLSIGKERISTRAGKVIFLEDVLKEAIRLAEQEIKKKNPKLKNKKAVAEAVGIAALKYSILGVEPIKDIAFSYERAISFEGDTGPYLQYAYARASSILRKAKKTGKIRKKLNLSLLTEKAEQQLIKKLGDFPFICESACKQLKPDLIATYAHELAQIFAEFYHCCQVIGSEKQGERLALVKATRQVLGNALSLLGIKALEEM